jgi:CheY-like chemotaxis protein
MGIKAGALFGGAVEQWAARTPNESPKAKAATVARTLETAFDNSGNSRLAGKNILWVDDDAASVALEIQGFETLGARVQQRLNTNDALKSLEASTPDLIISDMGRHPDDRAGYTLLKAIRERGLSVPVLIYSGSRKPEHVREALANGAQGATNDPEELLAFALRFA